MRMRSPSHCCFVVIALGLSPACAPFSDPPLLVCGNRIVEAEEDCDDPDDDGCGAPDRATACRWLCDPKDAEPTCDVDRVCGGDGVCRRPSGSFANPIVIDAAGVRWIERGDLDGDGRDDLVVQLHVPDRLPGVEAIYFDEPAGLQRVPLAQVIANAAVGDLEADGLAEVALAIEPPPQVEEPLSYGYGIWSGNAERVPAPRSLPTVRASGDVGRMLPGSGIEDDALELVGDELRRWRRDGDSELLGLTMPRTVDQLGDAIASVDIRDGSCANDDPRRLIALAYEGSDAVELLSLCGTATIELLPAVRLPAGSTLDRSGTFFDDIDDDGEPDLLTETGLVTVHVAYGVGDGSFHSSAATPPTAGDGNFAVLAQFSRFATGPLRAVADLDDDGSSEIICQDRVYWSYDACEVCFSPLLARSAAVVDLDRDGDLDIVAAGVQGDTLQLYLGDPALVESLTVQQIDLRGPARELVVGDFDADTATDVAFIETLDDQPHPITTIPMESISILHADADGVWDVERHGPFVALQSIAAASRHLVVARALDDASRPVGAFVSSESPMHIGDEVPRRPIVGRFIDPMGLELAALVSLPGAASDLLARLPLEVGGSASPYDASVGDAVPGGELAGYSYLEAPIDLDGDGIDELLVLGNVDDDTGWMWLARLSIEGDGAQWRIIAEHELDARFVRRAARAYGGLGEPLPPPQGDSQLRIGDLDGDGDEDALAIDDAEEPRLVALRNDGGVLAAAVVRLEQVADEPLRPTQLQPWHVDADGQSRWLVGGPDGVGIATVDLAASEVRIARITKEGTEALGVADVDGDGLLDLVLGTTDQLQIRTAEEARGAE